MIEEQFSSLRSLNDSIGAIEEDLARAWSEREQCIQDYYDLLRGILQVLDECTEVSDEAGCPGMVRAKIQKVLQEQGVEATCVEPGDRFSSETQCSEEVEPSFEYAPGTVLRLLETGYQRRCADGHRVVVRPARVVVTCSPPDSEESHP